MHDGVGTILSRTMDSAEEAHPASPAGTEPLSAHPSAWQRSLSPSAYHVAVAEGVL
ncbi:MAG: hypothetical protein FD153_1175 [Rhodospirillaceae bacterium]|nr:MAG: hypothetical protein FD153_1175 [Rhodospirillaceae bacterium]